MLVLVLVSLVANGPAWAQAPGVHYPQSSDLPPGAIGRVQLLRGGPLPGYYQPVEITAPAGAMISLAMGGALEPPRPAPRKVGLLIGQVYRLRVTRIPRYAGVEVFPTIEIINRLYPPPGQELRFPIPIELTEAELVLALQGKMVTRVIYLENPQDALPSREWEGKEHWFEAGPGDDPLKVADLLGRPVAILRMASRVPDRQGPDAAFLYGSPPWLDFGDANDGRDNDRPENDAAGAVRQTELLYADREAP